jgi:MoaA/NifB/PqqE/SkfB family radical SAM enzyme
VPFVRPDIFKIIDYAKTKGMYIEVNTNGTFDKDVFNKILETL